MNRKMGKARNSKVVHERHPFWVKAADSPRAPLDERALAIFQPDVLIDSQFRSTYSRQLPLDPERVLMLAVLRDAISCFQDHVSAQCKRKQLMHAEAEQWIVDRDNEHFFSFDNLCETLGLDPDYMRAGLLRWKESALRRYRGKERKHSLVGERRSS